MKEFPSGFCITGLKFDDGNNLALITAPKGMRVSGVFTTNICSAHPVRLSQKNINNSVHYAILVNSGSANAATGSKGKKIMLEMAGKVSSSLSVRKKEVLVASTGAIGKQIQVTDAGLNKLLAKKDSIEPESFAEAIMTTDTHKKIVRRSFNLHSKKISICGIAKGSGMVAPRLATMLAFIMTDVDIKKDILDSALKKVVDESFNSLVIDGETSTNDSVFLCASGAAGNRKITSDGKNFSKFYKYLKKVCVQLTEKLAADGEGATKFIKISVRGATDNEVAIKAARVVAYSPLCKTAFYGSSPNWGRIVSALGAANIKFNMKKFCLYVNDIAWVKNGRPYNKTSSDVRKVMEGSRYNLTIDFSSGTGVGVCYSCDFSPEYVRINAHYLT